MSLAINDLAAINFEQVKWITQLRNKVCSHGILTEKDISEAVDAVLAEDKCLEIAIIPERAEVNSKTRDSILYKLCNTNNISGLIDNQEIVFSPYFTLVHGKNGTGKSTYYKVLKDAFHSDQDIKGNIYIHDSRIPSASVMFTKRNAYQKHQRKGNIGDFENMHLTNEWKPKMRIGSKTKMCDADILSKSITKKDVGWSLHKFNINYFEILRDAVEQVEVAVKARINELRSAADIDLNLIRTNMRGTHDASYKKMLEQGNDANVLAILTNTSGLVLSKSYDTDKEKLERQVAIKATELTSDSELISARIQLVTEYVSCLSKRRDFLIDIRKLKDLVDTYGKLVTDRDFSSFEKFNLVFPLEGEVGNRDRFIELLRNIAELALSYEILDYPKSVDRCFYCNQTLTQESHSLITALHELVKSSLEKDIEQKKQEIDNTLKWLREKILNENISVELNTGHIGSIFLIQDQSEVDFVAVHESINQLDIFNTLAEGLADYKYVLNDEVAKSLSDYIDLALFLLDSEKTELTRLLRKNAIQLEQIEENKKKASKELADLLDINFLVTNNAVVERSKEGLAKVIAYNALDFSKIKTKISTAKAKTEENLVRSKYNEIFNNYLSKFKLPKSSYIERGFSIRDGVTKVEPKVRTEKGAFVLQGILSEGEAKIYSLCDWLTELNFSDVNTVIFDDPVNSLDQRNIDIFSTIIVELSSEYQVVVFTHHLEFYDKLIKRTLGTKAVDKSSCEICKVLPEKEQCGGRIGEKLFKCANYYRIEYTTQPGLASQEIEFFRFSYEQRIEDLKRRITSGQRGGLSADIRTTINAFFENYVLGDIKREVFKGEDLIHRWNDIKDISDDDYQELQSLHNRLSARAVHEPSIEIITELDILDYKNIVNSLIAVINRCLGISKKIELIP